MKRDPLILFSQILVAQETMLQHRHLATQCIVLAFILSGVVLGQKEAGEDSTQGMIEKVGLIHLPNSISFVIKLKDLT